MKIKTERIANLLEKEISEIISLEVHDEGIKFITITHVELTDDYESAKVYFTTLIDELKPTVEKSLNKASKFIRSELYKRIDIRHIPELRFVYDISVDTGLKINKIISELHEEK